MNKKEINAQFLYTDACDIWKNFCEHHNILYKLACHEHNLLLDSDIEGLEKCIEEKEEIIRAVDILEKQRSLLLTKIRSDYSAKVERASDLISFFQSYSKDDLLEQYNALLVEIIENIQEQNKRNKIFLNKALYSLNQIKKDFSGAGYSETYNAQGEKQLGMK